MDHVLAVVDRGSRPCELDRSGEEVAAAGPNLEEHVVGPQFERNQDAPNRGQRQAGRRRLVMAAPT